MKRETKLYIFHILFLISVLFVFAFLVYQNIFNLIFFENADYHFDVLTVTAIIAGFLFSGFSLLMSLYGSKTVEILERAGRFDKMILSYVLGFIFSISSILCSLFGLFLLPMRLILLEFLEIYFLLLCLLYFILSMYYLYIIVNDIRRKNKTKSREILERSQ